MAGDYDNDTHPDLLVLGETGLSLFRNDGRGIFEETTTAAGGAYTVTAQTEVGDTLLVYLDNDDTGLQLAAATVVADRVVGKPYLEIDIDREAIGRYGLTIGRVQGNDVILPKGNVSKRHSRIVVKDGKFIIVAEVVE